MSSQHRFSFGGLRRNGIPFFSRRIGLSRRGEPVDLDVGAKFTGRAGRWNVGFLGVALEDFQDVEGSNVFVGRLAANVLEESSVGLIATSGDPRSNIDNLLMGADFRYRNTRLPGGHTMEGEAWYQKSDTENVDGDETAWGIRLAARIRSPGRKSSRGSPLRCSTYGLPVSRVQSASWPDPATWTVSSTWGLPQ